jgi:hypothetical protein
VTTTRVPEGSFAAQTVSMSASGRATVVSCSSPASSIANIRGRPSVRARCSASGGTLPIPTPCSVIPVLRNVAASMSMLAPVIDPTWMKRVAWKWADGCAAARAARVCCAGVPHR